LGDVVDEGGGSIQTGPFGSQLHASDYVSEGIPCIMPANMKNNRVDVSEIARISEHDAKRLKRHIVQTGDIVYSRRGDVTQKALIREHENGFFCGTGCLLLRPGKKIDPAFLTYYLSTKTYQSWIASQAVGATMPNLNTGILNRVSFCAPDKDDQERIASVLTALDAKIELNQRINAELEGMAKLLYDYWFVQFDFPMTAAQAAALGKSKLAGHPYRASGGRMIYNEPLKREIPEGWTDGSLVDVATFTNGIACQKYPADGGDTLRVIKIKDMRTGLTPDSDIVTANVPTKVKIKNGDILFSWSASLEVMIWAGGEGALNQHIFKVTSDTHPRSFCYFVLLDYLHHFRMMADLRKTTMGHITIDHLEQSQIAIPDDAVAEAFEVVTKPIIDRMVKSHEVNQELTQLRDWLLPMLMNGQVTVG
jgi:type I restriction enzyme S subunit